METSEFGSGFIYCLINFAKHFDKVMVEYDNIQRLGNAYLTKHVYSTWINGASDHLYELEIPKNLPEPLKKMAIELQEIALKWGHGEYLMQEMTREQYQSMRKCLNVLCIGIDRWLGIEDKEAQWD